MSRAICAGAGAVSRRVWPCAVRSTICAATPLPCKIWQTSHWPKGDYAQAQALQEENLAIRRALGDRIGTADALHNLGRIAQEQGDLNRTIALYREALEIRRELGDKLTLAGSIENMAYVAILQKKWARAVRLYGAATALRTRANLPLSPSEEEKKQMAVRQIAGADACGSVRHRLDCWKRADLGAGGSRIAGGTLTPRFQTRYGSSHAAYTHTKIIAAKAGVVCRRDNGPHAERFALGHHGRVSPPERSWSA